MERKQKYVRPEFLRPQQTGQYRKIFVSAQYDRARALRRERGTDIIPETLFRGQ